MALLPTPPPPRRRLNLDVSPIETGVFVSGVVNGALVVLDKQPHPASVVSQYPQWSATVWGVALFVGATMCLLGSMWPRREVWDGVLVKRVVSQWTLIVQLVGLTAFGLACLAQAAAAYVTNHGPNNLANINLALWASCVWLYWRISRKLKEAQEGK